MTTGLSKIGKVASGALGLTTKAFGAVSAGVTAAATATGALITNAVKSYAEYEQLVGGVETLFQNSSDLVMEYAANAYQTAGLSANAYMETVTSFSASLLQGLGGDTEQAAEIANLAITDMSDNANKMGTDMEAIQNAYQGFAKQNYTMLDNLKLGYGGTQSEMIRLINDSGILEEKISSLDGISFDQMIQAIHAVQENMGITGTTALEASTTIEGSLNSAKAAWSNLVVGIADDTQDFDTLVNNFVESVVTAAGNILPRVETAITGIGKLIEELLPVIVQEIPTLINDVLPQLLDSGINMITVILDGIQQNLPQIMEGAMLIINQLLTAFLDNLPQLLDMGMQIILQLILGISESLPTLIPAIVDTMLTITETLIDNIDLLIDAAIQLITGLAEGLIAALPVLIEKGPEIIIKLVDAIIENVPKLLEAAYEILKKLEEGMNTYLPQLLAAIPQLVISLNNKFMGLASKFLEVGEKYISKIKDAIKNKWEDIKNSVSGWVSDLIQKFMDKMSEWRGIGDNIVNGIWDGISSGWDWLIEHISGLASDLVKKVKSILKINSPSKEFAYIGRMCVAGFDEGIENLMNPANITKDINASLSTLQMNASGTAAVSGKTPGIGSFNQTLNIYQPVQSPDEVARAVRIESRYGLMTGIPVGGGRFG